MPEISLTSFVDFVTRSGSPRLTKVRNIRDRGPYEPIRDFWKDLREGLIAFHQGEESTRKSALDTITDDAPDFRAGHYAAALVGYKRFLGRKSVQWFEPPRITWFEGDLGIRLNPELGLVINGVPTVVKVHFKSRRITKRRIECILLLMEDALRPHVAPGTRFAVLDLWRGKLFFSDQPRWNLRPFLVGEAAAFSTMWRELDREGLESVCRAWARKLDELDVAASEVVKAISEQVVDGVGQDALASVNAQQVEALGQLQIEALGQQQMAATSQDFAQAS